MREFAGGWLTLAAGTPWWLVWAQRLSLVLLGLLVIKVMASLFHVPKR